MVLRSVPDCPLYCQEEMLTASKDRDNQLKNDFCEGRLQESHIEEWLDQVNTSNRARTGP